MAGRVMQGLLRLNEDRDFEAATKELLLETLVMMWGALENFISEAVRVLVNLNPSLAVVLLSDATAKKYFPSRIPIEDLANNGFNIGNSMGDLLMQDRHLDALPVMKDVLGAIFPTEEEA